MNHLEDLVSYLHQDPSSLPNAPTNEAIIASAADTMLKQIERDLTPGERQGFLEMWQLSQVSDIVAQLSDCDLVETASYLQLEIDSEAVTEKRALDLRFLSLKLDAEMSIRVVE